MKLKPIWHVVKTSCTNGGNFPRGGKPTFVERLDAIDVAKTAGLPLAPIMIYGDDVTHLLTEEGIAYLYKASSQEERQAMIAAVAGVTSIGLTQDPKQQHV